MNLWTNSKNIFFNKKIIKKTKQKIIIKLSWLSFKYPEKFFKKLIEDMVSGLNIAAVNGITAPILIISRSDKIINNSIII